MLMQKYSYILKGDKRILKPNMSQCGPGTQIEVSPNLMLQYGNSLVKFYGNRTKRVTNQDTFHMLWWRREIEIDGEESRL